ncbi:universal stress protein [Aestuariibius sp. HNIBRBA575]|uniref:universal stress protein n=1 Tax=Aestuariibius sp. HNIBRBA575 TaxID=3233343 RepID=UPI0034A46E41
MYKNILVPVAFDDTHDNSSALNAARALVDEGGTITLLHVMDAVPTYAVSYLPAGYRTTARDGIISELNATADSVPGGKSDVIEGHPGTSIVEYANEKGADLIVVASHRPGFSDYFLGSTAARVVRHAQCAVHVTR